MKLRACCVVAAAFFATPAWAQMGAPTNLTPEQLAAMPPEARATAEALRDFGACIQEKIAAAAPNPDAAITARAAITACAPQKAAIERATEAMIGSPLVPASERALAREEFRSQLAALDANVIELVRARQSGPAQPVEATPQTTEEPEAEPETPLPG